jgi:hypothetical protein
MNSTQKLLLAALLGGVAAAAPADALTINLRGLSTISNDQAKYGFQVAAHYWESVLTNDANVNFRVGFESLGPTILGSTGSNLLTDLDIGTYQYLLGATGTSALDAQAVAHLSPLSPTGSVDVTVPGYQFVASHGGITTGSATRTAPDGTPISSTMALTTANVKALVGGFDNIEDAQIAFSSDFAFDFDPTNGITAGTYDFVGVAIHEMGHALGFVSGADDFDYSAGTGNFPVDAYWWGYAADMFRYTGEGDLNWAFGQPAYFSIDGGATAFNGAYFSTGTNYGDSWQASHWKAPIDGDGDFTCGAPFVGVMNPYICGGKEDSVTANDIALFDAIGWNTNVDALHNLGYEFTTGQAYQALGGAVPEPLTWSSMMVGFGAIGAVARRRRSKTAKA